MEIVLGKTAGFCYGVKRAVEGSLNELKQNKKIYCLGEIVHNKQVVKELQEKGIEFIENLDEVVEKNSKVIIRAHGVEKKIYEIARNNNIELVDYTCPKVLKIQEITEKYNKEGYYIILTGKESHPEVIGIKSHAENNFCAINDIDDVEKALNEFNKSNTKKLLLISQTTFNTQKFEKIKKEIEEKVSKEISLVINNTICPATEIRQKEIIELSATVDKMIIVGGKNSSNTKKLYELASQNCKDTIHIEDIEELKDAKFDNIKKVGIMAGASTPKEEIDKVTEYLRLL